MKENAKLFLVSIITIIISITGSAVANTMLQANSISYKTSDGDTTDVNSALDRLFDAADINGRLGNSDISSIGDGTVTGAINQLNNNLTLDYSDSSSEIQDIKTLLQKTLLKLFPKQLKLYYHGQMSDVMGGLYASGYRVNSATGCSAGTPTITMNSDYISIKSYQGYSGTVFSSKAIDLTGYSKITFTMSTVNGNYHTFGFTSVLKDGYVPAVTKQFAQTTFAGTYEIDISELTGNYYFFMNSMPGGGTNDGQLETARITEIILS